MYVVRHMPHGVAAAGAQKGHSAGPHHHGSPPLTVAPRPRAPLVVESLGDGRFNVSGGAEPHIVTVHPNGPLCDCKDFQFGKRRGRGCKHIDRVVAVQAAGEFIPPAVEVPGLEEGGPGLERDVPPPKELATPGGNGDHAPAANPIVGSIPRSAPSTSRGAAEAERAILGALLLPLDGMAGAG